MVTEIVMFLVTYALCNVNGHNCAANSMQGDYDGSGQQSCKCNYVDFSK